VSTSPTRRRRPLLAAAWLLLLALGVYELQWAIEQSRGRRGRDEPLYLPNGKILNVLSLGYDNVLADLLWLYSIQYALEEFWSGRKYEWLDHIFHLITDLDPQFKAAYMQGAIFLGMMQGRPDLAIGLLQKGKTNNPQDWEYPAEQSFYAMLHLKDIERAILYVKEAASIQGSPPQLMARLAGYYRRAGQRELSATQWMQLEKGSGDPRFRKVAQQNIMLLLDELAKDEPGRAADLWRSVASSTDDPDFAQLAHEREGRLRIQLRQSHPEPAPAP
jgi:hypothetical protein